MGAVAANGDLTYSIPWTVGAPVRADYRLWVGYRTNLSVWSFTAWDQSDTIFAVTGG